MGGMVPLLPVTRETGGLEIVPCSHEGPKKEALKERYPGWRRHHDFCVLGKEDPLQTQERLLLLAEPGDLILWDSRTVHGGRVGTQPAKAACDAPDAPAGYPGNTEKPSWMCSTPSCQKPSWNRSQGEYCCRQCRDGAQQADATAVELARMTVAVAMTPRALATPATEKERREGFLRGKPFTHRPHQKTHGGQCPGQFPVHALPTLNAAQRPLLGDVPTSPRDVFKHYAAAFRRTAAGETELFEGAAGQRALAVSDWAAGAWANAEAVSEVLLCGMEHERPDDAPAAAMGLLAELVAAGHLTAAEVAGGLGQLQELDVVEARLDFPKVDDYLARVAAEADVRGLGRSE